MTTNPDAPANVSITMPDADVTGSNEIVRLRFSNGMELLHARSQAVHGKPRLRRAEDLMGETR
jgi:hypothetical protein